jgi:hypothetical protein
MGKTLSLQLALYPAQAVQVALLGHIVVHFGLEGSLGAVVEHQLVFVYKKEGSDKVRWEHMGDLRAMDLAAVARR